MLNFLNKTFLITGAASGLGRATAVKLSECGANLVLLDLNETGLIETKKTCSEKSLITTLALDCTKFDDLKDTLDKNIDHGIVNGFVHCAGLPCISPLKALNYDTYLKVMQINTFSGLEIAKWFANKKNHSDDNPSVVFISSVYGLVGSAGNVAYAMSKGAVQSMTKALSIELASKHIRVNCVAPGFMHTKMEGNVSSYFDESHQEILNSLHPLGLGEAEDVANMIVFLLSDESRWTTGAIISVDGGFTAQ